ncbi:putative DNA-binding protein [Octadecabacter antarcticus 307]|uniref:Putative DNA-binding protein n=1 Tax=Octadecabacter antarcticus 307 TaxID=391626 RepID=M9R4X3_9RHOB|nr:AlpA family phage regulatory protein [Octadecabacter antarcticus]AGI66818.1 putative DNA-binding protein [Octadecabacter antarcticus 307]
MTFLSVNQLAERLSVSKDSIYRWKREGTFPSAVSLSPGTTRWRLSDIVEWENTLPTCLMTELDLTGIGIGHKDDIDTKI